MHTIDVNELREKFAHELNARKINGQADSYADQRGGDERLYGLLGAVHTRAALGLDLGSSSLRTATADRIVSYQNDDGLFEDEQTSGPAHALACSVAAINLLGVRPQNHVGPLAPTDPQLLENWLNQLDWSNTHKPLWGMTTPLLASGRVSSEWIDVLVAHVESRMGRRKPAEAMYRPDGPPWRVISEIYHVMAAFDAGCIPYPQPGRLSEQLLSLNWTDPKVANHQTACTDADWAWLLLRLARQRPQIYQEAMRQIRVVSSRRVEQWHEQSEALLADRTFNFYCFLWSTAVYQHAVPDHFTGPPLLDTLNLPALFRLA